MAEPRVAQMGAGGSGGASGGGIPQGQPEPPEYLERVTMGHQGPRTSKGVTFATFTGKVDGSVREYRMPYEEWVASDRPTIITITVAEGVPT